MSEIIINSRLHARFEVSKTGGDVMTVVDGACGWRTKLFGRNHLIRVEFNTNLPSDAEHTMLRSGKYAVICIDTIAVIVDTIAIRARVVNINTRIPQGVRYGIVVMDGAAMLVGFDRLKKEMSVTHLSVESRDYVFVGRAQSIPVVDKCLYRLSSIRLERLVMADNGESAMVELPPFSVTLYEGDFFVDRFGLNIILNLKDNSVEIRP